jgi:hypothetical protein
MEDHSRNRLFDIQLSTGHDSLSMGYMLLLCVFVEDIPQVFLTFLVDDYFEESYLSS